MLHQPQTVIEYLPEYRQSDSALTQERLIIGTIQRFLALGLIPFQGSNLIRQLLFRSHWEVLNIVVEIICRRQGLAADRRLKAPG